MGVEIHSVASFHWKCLPVGEYATAHHCDEQVAGLNCEDSDPGFVLAIGGTYDYHSQRPVMRSC